MDRRMRMGAKLGQAVTRDRVAAELRPLCEGSGVVEVVVYSWQLDRADIIV